MLIRAVVEPTPEWGGDQIEPRRFLNEEIIASGSHCGFHSTVSPAFAVKQLKDAFGENYAGEKADAEFKTLVKEANCNVCHVDKEDKKKVRNPYGEALHEKLGERQISNG